MESKGYICPQCKTIFSSLDVSRLLNVRTGSFDCDICPDSELQAYDPMILTTSGSKTASGPHELHSRLMEQTRLIVELLKKADEISIPAFNPALWLEQNSSKYSLLATELGKEDEGPQLAIAGANSSESQLSVSVELADEESVKTSSAASSVSTPLPEWHMYSTITGEAIRTTTINTENVKEKVKAVHEIVDSTDVVNYYNQMTADEDLPESPKEPKQPKLSSETEEPSPIALVMVAGKPVPLDQVTEDDKDKMTEEEYTQYYEVYMSTLQ